MATCEKAVSRRSVLVIILLIAIIQAVSAEEWEELVSGVVLPTRQVELSFASTGHIIRIQTIGSLVKKGEIIAWLDNRQAKAALAAARASVQIAQLTVEKAIHEQAKKTRLSQEQIISDMAIREAEFSVRSAEQELNLTRAKLLTAELDLADCLLIAPYAGVIVDNYVSAGENTSAGTAVVSFANLSRLSLTVDVPYSVSSSLQRGTWSTIESNGKIMGKVQVSIILPLIDPASGLRRVVWNVEESYVDILAGRYVTITPWDTE
jgi:RND family efflux transporter MFP subunit